MTNQFKIAIIDDAKVARMLMKKMLKEAGYDSFVEADSGVAGWELIVSEKPDIVFCDMKMEGMNGLELLEKVRSNTSTASLPFIMVSAERLDKDIQSAMDRGVTEYLTKPYGSKKLEEIVLRYL